MHPGKDLAVSLPSFDGLLPKGSHHLSALASLLAPLGLRRARENPNIEFRNPKLTELRHVLHPVSVSNLVLRASNFLVLRTSGRVLPATFLTLEQGECSDFPPLAE